MAFLIVILIFGQNPKKTFDGNIPWRESSDQKTRRWFLMEFLLSRYNTVVGQSEGRQRQPARVWEADLRGRSSRNYGEQVPGVEGQGQRRWREWVLFVHNDKPRELIVQERSFFRDFNFRRLATDLFHHWRKRRGTVCRQRAKWRDQNR